MTTGRVDARAAAKVSLSLVIRSAGHDGLHPLRGRFQSIDWYDALTVEESDDPGIAGVDGRPVIDGTANLAWRATDAAAEKIGVVARPRVTLDKQIAIAAGLGGGSADAAAALAATSYLYGQSPVAVAPLATTLGSDVPFCLVGGAADVSGTGGVVSRVDTVVDYALAVVVPPMEVSTTAVYRSWDELGGPWGDVIDVRHAPPSLRGRVELRNDLTAAAVAIAPGIAEWRGELATVWGRPVALSGSGPSMFAFFLDADEAAAALDVIPGGARHAVAASPVSAGWVVRFDGAGGRPDLVADGDGSSGWHTLRPGVLDAVFG